jgi:molybdopterin synthase sulfur carrier subunit
MNTELLFFGQLTDVTNTGMLRLQGATDTDHLLKMLYEKFAGLKGKKFAIAVNNIIIEKNTKLSHNDKVALMPPFSGG